MNGEDRIKPGSWLESVNCAIEGILWAARSQKNLRWHFLAAVAVLLTAMFFRLSAVELVLLAFAVTLVLFAELVNTAVEVLVDLVSPEYHPLARRAKDVAAGAVLVAAIGAVFIGYLALSHRILPLLGKGLSALGEPPPGEFSVVSVLTVVILVVLLKAGLGRGMPLHGGMPSGHAAVAFSIATSVTLTNIGPVPTLLTLAMAAMISQSRLMLKIHTSGEVFAGVLLGTGVTLAIYFLFA